MYQISAISQPEIKGFTPSPINGKLSGASLTIKIAITEDGAILQPQSPVRICAWLRTSQQQPFKYLLTTSGKKDDLLWTKDAADQGSLTLKFQIAIGDLDKTRLPKISFHGAQMRLRADLPKSMPWPSDIARLPDTLVQPNADLHSSKPNPPKKRRSSSSILKSILNQGTMHTPLNVVVLGIDGIHDATHLAQGLTFKMWKDLASRKLSVALFKPSTIVVADERHGMITREGMHWTTEGWAQKCIKNDYINSMINGRWNPLMAVRLRFQNLDSVGLGDGACDRAWNLMIATDDCSMNHDTRESKARQIKAITRSSIWHSTEKTPPKLLMTLKGKFPKEQMSLLDMVKSDGWEIIEQLKKLPKKLFPKAPRRSRMTYVLLENRLEPPDYVEINCPSNAKHAKTVNGPINVAENSTEGQTTRQEETTAHDVDMESRDIPTTVSKSPDLPITQTKAPAPVIPPKSKRRLDREKDRKHEAPDTLENSEFWAKRRDQLEERRQAIMRQPQEETLLGVGSGHASFI